MLSDFRQKFRRQSWYRGSKGNPIQKLTLRCISHACGMPINIELALMKNDFIHTKTMFKHDCMILEYPPMLHKISEKVIGDIKTDYDVQKPQENHRFSWRVSVFWWFSLSELYSGKWLQPTRLPPPPLIPTACSKGSGIPSCFHFGKFSRAQLSKKKHQA